MFDELINTPIVQINDTIIDRSGVQLFIKREDLTDTYISGNKFRKLKYNLLNAKAGGYTTLLTFGGAFSNHIHAVAYAGFKFGFKTIGIIRGEEVLPLNPTLEDAAAFGMEFQYISRESYRHKKNPAFIDKLRDDLGAFYLIPEGGSNTLAVKGCAEILIGIEKDFDHICCACGTGGTIAGLIASMAGKKKVWGFPALKNGAFLKNDIAALLHGYASEPYQNWDLVIDYHFGGYARYTYELVSFINRFKKAHKIQLDPIYTGKLMFGIYQLIANGFFVSGSKILAIHTGGFQGIKGFNQRFGDLIK
ncbi:MAG: 1-aminocyclopropane-1-carboxylate deaminase/D-cysteine desulfhydrase [Cyclobacteriaceae bacterium]|nr:1-aminocyclopropane-1-carboxylate deaminase/D-cysteine desulfhydrase [Cyclobacteriaceae bacterium]